MATLQTKYQEWAISTKECVLAEDPGIGGGPVLDFILLASPSIWPFPRSTEAGIRSFFAASCSLDGVRPRRPLRLGGG